MLRYTAIRKCSQPILKSPVFCVMIHPQPLLFRIDLCHNNMKFSIKNLKGEYNLTDGDETTPKTSLLDIHDSYSISMSGLTAAFSILLAALVGALGVWIGQCAFQSRSTHHQSQLREPGINFQSDRYHFRTFMYNGTFASAPSEETNMAWDSLFPGK